HSNKMTPTAGNTAIHTLRDEILRAGKRTNYVRMSIAVTSLPLLLLVGLLAFLAVSFARQDGPVAVDHGQNRVWFLRTVIGGGLIALAVSVGSAGLYRGLAFFRLRRLLATLPWEQQERALLPLRGVTSGDAGTIVEELL